MRTLRFVFGRLARRHEAVLQIDDDQRGARRIENVEGMQPAAAGQRPLDCPGWDFDLVHGLRLSRTLPVSRPTPRRYIPFPPRNGICPLGWRDGRRHSRTYPVPEYSDGNGRTTPARTMPLPFLNSIPWVC
jgi:hypothetical protein